MHVRGEAEDVRAHGRCAKVGPVRSGPSAAVTDRASYVAYAQSRGNGRASFPFLLVGYFLSLRSSKGAE